MKNRSTFSLCCLKHWTGTATERAKNVVIGIAVVSRCEEIGWNRSGRSQIGDCSGERNHTSRFEQQSEIQPLLLRTGVVYADIRHNINVSIFFGFMVAVWNTAQHYIFALWFLLSMFLRLFSAVKDCMSTILPHMVWP